MPAKKKVCAVGDQVPNEAAGGLKLLPRTCYRRVDEVLTEKIAFGPLVLVLRESQPLKSPCQCRIDWIANGSRQ